MCYNRFLLKDLICTLFNVKPHVTVKILEKKFIAVLNKP